MNQYLNTVMNEMSCYYKVSPSTELFIQQGTAERTQDLLEQRVHFSEWKKVNIFFSSFYVGILVDNRTMSVSLALGVDWSI